MTEMADKRCDLRISCVDSAQLIANISPAEIIAHPEASSYPVVELAVVCSKFASAWRSDRVGVAVAVVRPRRDPGFQRVIVADL